MEQSILKSVKKNLGLDEGYDVFDQDVIMHINTAFSTLSQLGLGPDGGLTIEDDSAEWRSFIGNDPELNPVKTYVYLTVRLIFDPPAAAYVLTAFKDQLRELEWRLNAVRESTQWTDPTPEEVVADV